MAEVTDLNEYRKSKANKRFMDAWHKEFDTVYNPVDGLSGIPDNQLYFLAQPGDKSSRVFYRLINATLDLSDSHSLSHYQVMDRMRVMDIHLFLADRIRFEMMRRLGWLASFSGESMSMVDLINAFDRLQYKDNEEPPLLAENHPDFQLFHQLINREKAVFVRKLFSEALLAFQNQIIK